MATTRSLQGLDWMVRTYGPALLTTCERPSDAAFLAGLNPITNTTRLNAAITRLNTMEATLKSEYGETWDAKWSEALEYVEGQVWAQCPIPPSEILADPDTKARQAFKTTLRGLELVACKYLADGGVLT